MDLISWTILSSERPVDVPGGVGVAVGAETEGVVVADEVIAGVDVEIVEEEVAPLDSITVSLRQVAQTRKALRQVAQTRKALRQVAPGSHADLTESNRKISCARAQCGRLRMRSVNELDK